MELRDENENFPVASKAWAALLTTSSEICPSSLISALSEVADLPQTKSYQDGADLINIKEEFYLPCKGTGVKALSEGTPDVMVDGHEVRQVANSYVENQLQQIAADNQAIAEKSKLADSESHVKARPSMGILLATKKQQLSLPNLIPNGVVTSAIDPKETVSESDEYERADEQQTIHDSLFLDTTVNLVLNAFDSSTPVDNPSWTSNVFFPGGRAPLRPTTKMVVLETIEDAADSHPIIASTPALEEATPVASVLRSQQAEDEITEETDIVGVLQDFAKTGIRSSQPFSPSSDSDVESSVLELVENTISAPVEMQPTAEVEVELASQFERLVLSKQASMEGKQTDTLFGATDYKKDCTPLLNHTISLEVNARNGSLNQTAPLDVEPVKQQVGVASPSVKMDVSVAEQACNSVAVEQDRTKQHNLKDSNCMLMAAEDSSDGVSSIEGVKEETDTGTRDTGTGNLEGTYQTNGARGKQRFCKPPSLPEDKPIVPKKGYDLSFLDKFDNLENATPSFSHAEFSLPFPPTAASQSPAATGEGIAVTTLNEEPIEVLAFAKTNPEDGPAMLVKSSFIESSPEPKVGIETAAPVEKPIESLPVEETLILSSVNDNGSKDLRKDDEPVIPKKSYDLSWLDKCENLETATPPGLSSTSRAGSRKLDKKESFKGDRLKPGGPFFEATDAPAVEQKSETGNAAKFSNESPTKNTSAIESIHPEFQRSTPATRKTDTSETEFQFIPNDDPLTPKTKLCSSPKIGESSSFAQNAFEDTFPSLEANSTINATDGNISNEANITVINTLAEQQQENDSISTRLPDQTLHADEEFRPAQEVFRDSSDLDFLMQHGSSSHDIALARQSLFVKFDPLVGGRPSLFPALEPNRASGGDETILIEEQSSGRKSTGESLFLFSPPHASGASEPKPERKHQEPVVDGLMSSVIRVIADDVIGLHEHKEVLQRQELLFQDKFLQKEREILMREKQIRDLKAELDCALDAKTRINQTLSDYEKTISQLIADKEREKANMEATIQTTIKERDQATEDLKEVERAFSEFHRMYERNRAAAERLQKNEEALKKSIDAYKERVQQEQLKFETLKLRSAEKLEKALQDMENMKRALESEITQLKAQLKKTEMRVASAEASLEQKYRENQELTKLCDELITKMGSGAK